jgi:hypothetical protein
MLNCAFAIYNKLYVLGDIYGFWFANGKETE